MIIHLLQALYDPRTACPDDNEFYKQALEDIQYFDISPQVYFLLKQRGRLEHIPSFFQECLKQDYTEALYQNMVIKNRTVQLLNAFEKAEIQVMPLKGVLFAEKYFGHMGARRTSDIDLLIKRSDLYKAIACVKSLGFTNEEEYIPSHFHWSFSQSIPGSPVPLTVELHWDLLKEHTSRLNINDLWSQAEPLESYKFGRQLSEPHTFYMICLHGWRHNLDNLKYFIDIIQMIHYLKDSLDYEGLFRNAEDHQTFKRISRTLSIVYREFPHLQDLKELPLRKRTELWWDYQAIRHVRPRTFKDYLNFVFYLCMDFDTAKHSLIGISDWLFPSKSAIRSEMGIDRRGGSGPLDYLRLYKKRWTNFFHTIRTNKTP